MLKIIVHSSNFINIESYRNLQLIFNTFPTLSDFLFFTSHALPAKDIVLF